MLLGLPGVAWAIPDVDAPLRTGERAPADAAVVIGVEDYFALDDVPYAANDASAFYDFLVYTRGVPAANVRRLTEGPNREKILRAVEEAAAATGAGGTLWVYFAGHGAASPTDGERMLLGVDAQADADSFEARAVRLAEIRERAARGAGKLLMVLDTCYTGQGRNGATVLGGKRFAVPSYAAQRPEAAVTAEWTAASANQFSGPLDAAKHGAFTWAVLGALRGWADGQVSGQRDGQVTAEEADLFVREALRTVQITDQDPVLASVAPDGVVLSKGKGLERRPELRPPAPAPAPAPAPVPVPSPVVPPPAPIPPPVPATLSGGDALGVARGLAAYGQCTASACGGDPSGTWALLGVEMSPALAGGVPGARVVANLAGTVTFQPQGFFEEKLRGTLAWVQAYGGDVTPQSCGYLAQMTGMPFAPGSAGCEVSQPYVPASGTWSANAGVLFESGTSGQSAACYCVAGDRLLFSEPNGAFVGAYQRR